MSVQLTVYVCVIVDHHLQCMCVCVCVCVCACVQGKSSLVVKLVAMGDMDIEQENDCECFN